MYQEALSPLLQQAELLYSSSGQVDVNNRPIESFFPPELNGQPNPKWPDDGGDGVGTNRAETYAELFAFVSLLATDGKQKEAYAVKAKNLLMHIMNAAAACTDKSQPYCSDIFAFFNRANYIGEAYGLTVDWIYPYLSADDKKTIRAVFLEWADQIVKAVYFTPDLSYIKPPVDLTSQSNTQLLSNQWNGNNQRQFRWSANNYYSGSMRNLMLMVLSFDEADDPPVDAAKPVTDLGNTLRSYLPYLYNVVLYQQYAMYSDPETVIDAYGLQKILSSVDGPGLASGGLPVEGLLYGHSLGYVLEGLLALHTAGYDDTGKHGPQAGLFASPYWDQVRDGFLSSLTLQPVSTPSTFPFRTVYQMASYGDLLSYYITDYDYVPLIASLAVRSQKQGDDDGGKKALWALVNTMPGGADYLTTNLAAALTTSGSTTAILAFMALDPGVPWSSYPDPRPDMPLTFHAKPLARVLQRTSWAPDASWFDHICSWESINHQDGDCGQFELYRKGEWLTGERHGYDNSVYDKSQNLVSLPYGYSPDYHNTLSIQNDLSHVDLSKLSDDEKATAERGGQWINGANAGDPASVVSAADDQPYTYVQDVMTNLYNRVFHKISDVPDSRATAVQHASRSLVWIKPDHLVIYDRATTGAQDAASPDVPLFKRFNLVLFAKRGSKPATTKNESGYLTWETTPNGQSLFVQTLLPTTATPQLLDLELQHPAEIMDPTNDQAVAGVRFRVEDPGTAGDDTRFLHVLQGADAGKAQDAVTLVTSSAGTAFEGAVIKKSGASVVVLFLKDLAQRDALASTTFSVPSGSNDVYVVDLKPKATYYVKTGQPVVIAADGSAGGSATTTDGAGVLHVTF